MKLNHFSKSVIGLVRKANEDSIGSLTNKQTNGNGDIFVVCDGMGGHVGGATASQTAIKCILQYFEQEVNTNPIVALEKAISFANQQIFGLAQQDPSLKGMGTTCTVLLCKEDKIYIAHVGDSRIYINTDNKLYRITKDHSFVQKLVDAGQLEDSEMETHPRKNELTKALGIAANVEVEVAENPILPKSGDKFLMCSDGLCGLVNDLTIANTINNTVGLDAVNELIQLAENAGGNDNISVDIIDVIQSPHSKTIFKDQGNKSLTATQVLDIPSMKGDMKLLTIFKRYQVYILSALLVLLLGSAYFIYPLIKGERTPLSNEPDPTATPIDSSKNNIQNPDSDTEGEENTESEIEDEVKKEDGGTSTQNNWGDRTKKDADADVAAEEKEKERIAFEKSKKNKTNKSLLNQAKKYLKSIKVKLEGNKYNKHKTHYKYRQLTTALTNLKVACDNLQYKKIPNKRNLVEDKLKDLDAKINNDIIATAKSKARTQIRTLLEDSSVNAKKDMATEIEALKNAIKGDDISVIEKAIETLTNKETAVRTAIEKKKSPIVPDSVKPNTQPKD